MSVAVAPIVEGHGDVDAVGVLLRYMLPGCRVATPVRLPKSKMQIESELQKMAAIARSNIRTGEEGLLLLILDADSDCPAELGPKLLRTLTGRFSDVKCYVAVVKREFESWIAGGVLGVADPEQAGDPKGLVKTANNGVYRESVDQARFASRIDHDLLKQRSASFRRFSEYLSRFKE